MRLPLASLLMAALMGASAVPASGQLSGPDRSWSLSVFAEGGGLIPVRSLGRAVGIYPAFEIQQQQVISDLENAANLGGGVEVLLPGGDIMIRASYNVTTGGSVTGRLGFCGQPGSPLLTGDICDSFSADARVHSVGADLGFVRGSAGDLLRPVILIGAGLRKYQIGDVTCPGPGTDDISNIQNRTCLLLTEIWGDQGGITPVLRFGLGLQVDLGPVALRATALDVIGRYPGGTSETDGHGQNDVMLSAGLAFRVF